MQRSVGLCSLLQPMAYSWLQNSRVACCCYSATAAHLPVGAAGQSISTTLSAAGDSAQTFQQQQEVSCLSHQETGPPQNQPIRQLNSLSFPVHVKLSLCSSSQQFGSCQQQAHLSRLLVLQQPLQTASFSTSSSCRQPYRSYAFQQLHGIHPGQQPLGGGSPQQGSVDQQQQQQPIQGEVTVHPFPYEGYQEGDGTNGFKHRSFRRREPQFQVQDKSAGGGSGGMACCAVLCSALAGRITSAWSMCYICAQLWFCYPWAACAWPSLIAVLGLFNSVVAAY